MRGGCRDNLGEGVKGSIEGSRATKRDGDRCVDMVAIGEEGVTLEVAKKAMGVVGSENLFLY